MANSQTLQLSATITLELPQAMNNSLSKCNSLTGLPGAEWYYTRAGNLSPNHGGSASENQHSVGQSKQYLRREVSLRTLIYNHTAITIPSPEFSTAPSCGRITNYAPSRRQTLLCRERKRWLTVSRRYHDLMTIIW